ncbi:MAG: DNA (cytosine-5-)-methyltransferase, partial [Eubacteriales bacterium]|nr:DNA (cytosine-5-)-methyltransferase [Eubacteriales bacterium]
MEFIDLFAGVGGFRRGMELAGHKCIGFCEYDKFAVGSYTAMHLMTDAERENIKSLPMNKRLSEVLKEGYRHNEWYSNDIRRLRADDIPRADVWCFGFPCQDISVAGKQKGLAGNRSGLFHTVIKLIEDTEEENRPSMLFIENVKNLLSINRGYDFLTVLVELDKIGYDAEWQVINSADYVPQNRERVFIIGHLRGRSGRKVFPIEAADRKNSVSIIGHRDGYRRNSQTYSPDGITEALDTA